MEYEIQLKEIARDEDRKFALLDSKISSEKFDFELFGEDYDAKNVNASVMKFVDLWNLRETIVKFEQL